MKTKVFAALFFVMGVSVASAQIKLSFNPNKGDKYEYQTEVLQNITQNVMGQEIPIEMEMSQKYLMVIKDKSSQEITAQYTYKEMSYIVSSPMMKMGYDSRNPIENPSEIDKLVGKMLGAFIDQSFTVVFAPDGSVKSISGMDEIVGKMIDVVSPDDAMAAPLIASMQQQFGEDAMKTSFGQSFKIYPANAVKPGDSWNSKSTTTANNMNVELNTTYSLKSNNKNVAIIDAVSEMNMTPGEGMEGNITGTQNGTMTLDSKTGIQISSDISQALKGTLHVQGMDVQMDLSTKMKSSITKVK